MNHSRKFGFKYFTNAKAAAFYFIKEDNNLYYYQRENDKIKEK